MDKSLLNYLDWKIETDNGKVAQEQRTVSLDGKCFSIMHLCLHVLLLLEEQLAQTTPGGVVALVDSNRIAETVLRLWLQPHFKVLQA